MPICELDCLEVKQMIPLENGSDEIKQLSSHVSGRGPLHAWGSLAKALQCSHTLFCYRAAQHAGWTRVYY